MSLVSSVGSVLVRAGAVQDLPALTDLYNHYVLHDHATFDVEPSTVEARRAWFDHYGDTGPHRLLVAELAGTVAGYATSSAHRAKPGYATSVETTVYCLGRKFGRWVDVRWFERPLP